MSQLPICRGADIREPCKYAGVCAPTLQAVQSLNDMRGTRCVHYEMRELEGRYPGDLVEPRLVRIGTPV